MTALNANVATDATQGEPGMFVGFSFITTNDAPAFLSEECMGFFEKDVQDLPIELREKMKLHLRMAYSRGRSAGFIAGLENGSDIANGSPKAKANDDGEDFGDWLINQKGGEHDVVAIASASNGCVIVERPFTAPAPRAPLGRLLYAAHSNDYHSR